MQDLKINLKQYLPESDRKAGKDEALKKACKEFESVFTYQLLKSMRSTVEKCDLFHGGQGEEIYESLLDQELAKSVSEGGEKGLAHLLYQQLRRPDPSEAKEGKDIRAYGTGERNEPSWPLEARVSSGFGWRRDPINGETRFHQGIDLAAEKGTPVHAALPGRVIMSGHQEGYGNVVVVDHGKGVTTLYAHNQINLVKQGDWVGEGDTLARVGSSGRSTGPHLHFEVRRHGRHLDPCRFLDPQA